MTEERVIAFAKELGGAEGQAYLEKYRQIQKLKKERQDHQNKIKELRQEMRTFSEKVKDVSENIDSISQELKVVRVLKRLSPKEQIKYKACRATLDECRKKMNAFLSSKPQGTPEDRKIYAELNKAIEEAQKAVNDF